MKIRMWSIEEMYDETVYLIDKDNEFFYYCNRLCYRWIRYIKKEAMIKEIYLEKVKKEKYTYIMDKDKANETEEKRWCFSYEIDDKNVVFLNDIALFFDTFLSLKEKSPASVVELAIEKIKKKIPKEILKDMLVFTLDYYAKHPDRLRLLYKVRSSYCF